MKRVFLGGTCNGSKWRMDLISMLTINFYDPYDWEIENTDPRDKEEELIQREICDYLLYTITPKMAGIYSIAELVDDSNKRPEKTILCILTQDEKDKFNSQQLQSFMDLVDMVEKNGIITFTDLEEVANYLNKKGEESNAK